MEEMIRPLSSVFSGYPLLGNPGTLPSKRLISLDSLPYGFPPATGISEGSNDISSDINFSRARTSYYDPESHPEEGSQWRRV